jgi:hypothetical protein
MRPTKEHKQVIYNSIISNELELCTRNVTFLHLSKSLTSNAFVRKYFTSLTSVTPFFSMAYCVNNEYKLLTSVPVLHSTSVFSCKQKAGQEVFLLMSKLIPSKIFCSVRKRVTSFSISICFSFSLSNKNFLLYITAIFRFLGEETD